MTLFPPSFSGLLRGKDGTDLHRSRYPDVFFFIFFVASPPFLSVSLFFFSFFSIRTREGCFARIQGGRCTRARGKTWRRGPTLLERVLKTAVGEEKKKKARKKEKVVNGQERAKTRPDGNDPKEFRDPPFLSSFLFLLLRFATLSSSFPHTFLPLPSLPPTYHAPDLCLSFYSGPGTIANALTQRTPSVEKAKTSSDGNDLGIFLRHCRLFLARFFLLYYCHDFPLFAS